MQLDTLLTVLFVATGAMMAFADDPKPQVKRWDDLPPLKERKSFDWTKAKEYEGLVTEIDKDAVMVDGKQAGYNQKATYKFHALDLYKADEIPETARGWCSYRWQDVKVGDTILVKVMKDEESSVFKPYVIEICIRRRPGDKLPESQKPKEDKLRWQKDSLLNDIDNGKDVNDEDIQKLFPPVLDPQTRKVDRPGGIPAESREKLTALREKLEAEKAKKELKATPPEKK